MITGVADRFPIGAFRWSLQQNRFALRGVSDGFPVLPPEIVQNLLILFSLVLFSSINNQPERNYFVFPLDMSIGILWRSAIRCQIAKPWR